MQDTDDWKQIIEPFLRQIWHIFQIFSETLPHLQQSGWVVKQVMVTNMISSGRGINELSSDMQHDMNRSQITEIKKN